MNRMKAAMLLAALSALFLWIGQSLGGQQGFVLALLLAGGMNFASHWWSDRIVLRMHGAEGVNEQESPTCAHWRGDGWASRPDRDRRSA